MDKRIVDKLLSPFWSSFFLFKSLPGAWFFRLKIKELNSQMAVVSVPYGWTTQNPFKSIYFAALTAAAELSTGCIALAGTYGKNMSMLVTGMEGNFTKKAKGTILFKCEDAPTILAAIESASTGQNGVDVIANTVGFNHEGVAVANFSFKWSFKKK